MKIYRVIDDGEIVLTTDSHYRALLEFYHRTQKYDRIRDWGWIDEEEVE